jgi:outer membrane protein assembly factor BamA
LLDADGELGELLRKERFLAATVKHRVLRRGRHAFLYVYLDTGPQTRFRFEGRRAFDERDLVEALALGSTQDTDPQSLADRLRSYYVQRGFFDARVRAAEAQLEDGAVREISFSLVEGEPVRVARRLFPCLPLDAGPGLGAADLGAEIDAFLDGDLPKTSLLASVDETVVDGLLGGGGGRRAAPHRLVPALTYHPDSYERALKHLEEVLASKGYLNSRVGPVSVIRAECDPTARAGRCAPLGLPPYPEPACRVDALDLPLAEPPLDERLECVPEPGRGISCAPELTVSIPVLLGPATVRYDLSFEGNKTLSAHELAEIAEFPLGEPFSILELDAARSRIQNAYADRGYTYAEVRADVDYSPDRTRARARFTVNERQPVVITGYEVRGAVRTDPARIIGRLALCRELERCSDEERVFKRNLARASEEQIATLGTFASVSLGLEDPDIPQARKRVIITVVEQRSQYLEPRAGFSTGEGLRLAFEYGHRNVGGQAIALTVRLEFAFLPDALILDRDVRENYARFVNDVAERLERRNSVSLRFPEIGLGPKVELAVDGIDVRDNQRDFGLGREAVVPTLSYRPARSVTLQGATSVEVNDVTLFDEGGVAAAIKRNPALANLLRVPDGRTLALAQRASVSWDRRDNALSATRGTFVTTGVEHVSALPLDPQTVLKSEFLRLTTRGAGYVPLTEGGMALAISMAVGYNLQLTSDSVTYPDRLFFLGGVSTVRGFQLDSVVPEDVARQLLDGHIGIDDVGVRGGNLYVNPRVELRLPLNDTFSVGLFLDTGNVWSEPESIESVSDLLALRYAAGTGLRASTPIGPVALDGGINLVRREWEDVGAIHFSIGLF